MKKKYSNIIIVAVFIIGLSLLLYPTIANKWNTYRQSKLISNYDAKVAELKKDGKIDYEKEWKNARDYNSALVPMILPDSFAIADAKEEKDRSYESCLNITGDGIMGMVEIPKIDVELPIYHYTTEEVLKNAAGHLEGSSLPIGGKSTHSVISAHRGLPSAILFTDLDKMKIEEQKRAVRSGYDMDVLPSDLVTYGEEAKNLLEDLQSRNERMFLVTFLVMNTAKKRQKLDNNIFQVQGIAQKYNCSLKQLDYQQEAALMSCIPLGVNRIEIQRGLTTSSTAIFVPFTTQELFQEGEALYYGLNALSNNMIMVDRKRLKNPNGLILGTPGSGKSFSAKREITNCFLITEDDIIVCDPEAEYSALVQALHGQVVRVSPVSDQYINPMDLNLNYSEEDNPLSLKADFILSLCELIVGGKNGLEPVEKTIIDRCVRLVYQEYLADPVPEKMPILEDLYNLLRKQEEPEAQRLATSLEIYVTGSLNVFNHQTNVDINNRIVCFDIKELGKQLKKIGMLVIQDQVWNRVTMNRSAHKSTRYYVDEFHLLLKEEQTAAYSVEIWKRFRKWGGIPTGITQNIKDLLSSREIENIFENSDFIYMLNQASGDRQILAKQLNISPTQLSYVTNSNEGEGLLFYGNVIIPFVDRFPKNSLYKIMTTRLEETSEAG